MNILVCEANFMGYLTAVYSYYADFKGQGKITSDRSSFNFFDDYKEIKTDVKLANKVRSGVIQKYGYQIYNEVYDAYLNHDNNKEDKILNYLKILFKHGIKVRNMYDQAEVVEFNILRNRVLFEAHRLVGFIRFQEMTNGIYYGYFGSDNDVLEIITPHFKNRFNSQRFIIHDVRRGKMVFYDGQKCNFTQAPEYIEIEISDAEVLFSKLWQQYHKNVSIILRENKRLQNGFAPRKYRFFMNEF